MLFIDREVYQISCHQPMWCRDERAVEAVIAGKDGRVHAVSYI